MTKNQKILKGLSLAVVIWNTAAVILKLIILTIILMLTFLVVNNSNAADKIAGTLNNVFSSSSEDFSADTDNQFENGGFVPYDEQYDEQQDMDSFKPLFKAYDKIKISGIAGSDIQACGAAFAVVLISYIVWTIFSKFFIILAGVLGLKGSKAPQNLKTPLIIGYVISVFCIIGILIDVAAGGAVGVLSALSPILFIVFTVYVRVVLKEYQSQTRAEAAAAEEAK